MATHRRHSAILFAVVAAVWAVAPAAAQEAGGEASAEEGEVALVYERETFVYPARNRPDPFRPLVGGEGLGPRVEDLTVKGILYARERSVALIVDGGGEMYRLRRGQTIGNARVLEIRPAQVIFAVDEFGVVRQHVLELQRERERSQGTGQ